ncbi:MAG: hypothetical protein OXD39_10175 [Gemmatimonadetes bacterium]|nr:hypothetical protein [Gemmatimonadota bacterium]
MNSVSDFDELWDYNDPVNTEKVFRELLPESRASGDPDYHTQLLTQIARTHSLRRQFNEAHHILDDAEALLSDETPVARVRYLLERGRTFNSAGEIEAARPLFEEAWDLARGIGEDYHAVDAAHMLGICETGDKALRWNEIAMEAAEASHDSRAKEWLGALYNNTGWTYHDAGEFQRALECFEKGLAWRVERNDPVTTRIAKWSVARALRSLERTSEALDMQRSLLAELESAGTKDGYVYEELAECLLILGKADDARPFFNLAYHELSKDAWLKENEADRLDRLQRFGEP